MPSLRSSKWSRREVLKQSGILSALGVASAGSPVAASAAAFADPSRPKNMLMRDGDIHDNLFTRIGVRPMVNGRGTFTIISGSCSLPEVKQAMYDASFYFVQLDGDDEWHRCAAGRTDRRRVGNHYNRLRGRDLPGTPLPA